MRPHQYTTWIRRKNGPNLSVWRQRVDGTLGCAAPCVLCQRELLRFDMRVHCTTPGDGFFRGRLDEEGAPSCKLTTGQMRLMFRQSGNQQDATQGGRGNSKQQKGGREGMGKEQQSRGAHGKDWFRKEQLRKEQQRKEKSRREEAARMQAAKREESKQLQVSIQQAGDLMCEVERGRQADNNSSSSSSSGSSVDAGGRQPRQQSPLRLCDGALEDSRGRRRCSSSGSSDSRSSSSSGGGSSSSSSSSSSSKVGDRGVENRAGRSPQHVHQCTAVAEKHAKLMAKLQASGEKQPRGRKNRKKGGKKK
ncbi:hypothetical protein DUNSADRAFT_3591 [Dunaliella salina]|uniref:Uncharacterized protein n=1 Tax=Dunaliella salina TaxID=3046 RepID=A0ABQ7GTR6_DUNSA|nr:hypothetical protein DUNSADRAFT_3591 [Dunaliella salina]|eukprot:KAF5837998.1 hypothetical protein DUNSADRAFT_3591 [Dunaliella salina]